MKPTPFADRPTYTSRDVKAGCFVCHDGVARWYGGNAQGVAARHHDATGHETWCDVYLSVRYGEQAHDPRQIDLEDAIASARSGGEPDAAPLTVPDASTVAAAGVSASSAAHRDMPFNGRGARGQQPETACA